MIRTTTQKAADATNANGLHTNTTSIDFLTAAALEQAPSGKAIATEIARLALAGHAIHKGSAGDFTELQAFSRKLGVTK